MAETALSFAFQYGLPFYFYGRVITGFPDAKANLTYHKRKLLGPEFKEVPRPNQDTLYTYIFFDLSSTDLAVTLPDMGTRFWNFPFHDLFGNNFANIGSLTPKYPPGKYLLRRTDDNHGVQTEGVKDGYTGYVNCSTPYGFLPTRLLLRNTTTDVKTVHAWQDAIIPELVERPGPPIAPPLNLQMWAEPKYNVSATNSLVKATLELTATLAPYNLPTVADREWVAEKLAEAGIKDGKFVQPPGTDLDKVAKMADEESSAWAKSQNVNENMGNDWSMTSPWITGDYGSHYTGRYFLTKFIYLQQTPDIGILPFYAPGGNNYGVYRLEADEAYLFSFSSKPPVSSSGYWSLSIYDEDQFFIANERGQYARGDRSPLRYEDGTLLSERDDGPFQIIMQPADITPPDKWLDNWLPGPTGGANWTMSLRMFGPKPEVLEKQWTFPKIERIPALRK